MKDPRGIERGKCTKCTCTAYEWEKGSARAACTYCECPAPLHEEVSAYILNKDNNLIPYNGLERTVVSTPSTSFSTSSSVPSTSSPSDSLICLDFQGNSTFFNNDNFMDMEVNESNEPSSQEIESHFPKKFPKKIEEALKNNSLDANHKSVMTQWVVASLHEKGLLSNACLQKAARRMCKRWPPLKNDLDPQHKAMYEKLRRRKERLNALTTRKTANTEDTEGDSLSPQAAKDEMFKNWASGIRSTAAYRSNMILCRSLRKEESKKCPGLQLFRQYPALAITDLILAEFEFEMGLSRAQMIDNWTRAVPKLVDYYMQVKLPCLMFGSIGELTVPILERIHLLPLWVRKKQAGNRSARILDIFPVNTALDEMRPGPKEPPRLLGTGSAMEDSLSLHCYLDTEPFFQTDDPVQALLLLLAAYFVMGIKWPPHTRLPLVFLCCVIGAKQKVSGDIARNNKFQDLLNNLNFL